MNESIRTLPGIGEKRAAQYERLGIATVGDLLRHFPRAYQNRGQTTRLIDVQDGEIHSVIVTVATEPRLTPPLKNRLILLKFRVFDESATATVTFFQQSYLKEVFRVGTSFRLYGRFHVRVGAIDITSPQFEPISPASPLPDLVPVYPLTEGLSGKMIAAAVTAALNRIAGRALPDPLPEQARESRGLPDLATALRMIHRPKDEEELRIARERFVFESLYLFSLGVSARERERNSARPYPLAAADPSPFLSSLPFALTPDQLRCIEDVRRDMSPSASRPMARLISGDVGSGKTVVAAAALYLCAKGGAQALMMAPTEILATQHYRDLAPLFASLGIECALLTGSVKASEKRRIRADLAAGNLPIVIGTHALLSEGVHAARLGLVITDEQHRFGVEQRARLAGSAERDPHVLVMSATPIPRTLALILYGDLDASTIETLPPGRQVVDTFVVGESYRERLEAFIRKQVGLGGQVYVVCPAIEPPPESEEEETGDLIPFDPRPQEALPLRYATEHAAYLAERLPELTVGCLHGRMKGAEKDAVMADFAAGRISVLVSTTVIEVGVNVPDASLMLVENAERFGLSQLHQLRGRVGRGARKSYCVLVSDAKGEVARKRLKILAESHSGYQIAREDLSLRGPGDFFPAREGSARQSGQFSIGLASLCTDLDQLRDAAALARTVLERDPTLSLPENEAARQASGALFYATRHSVS